METGIGKRELGKDNWEWKVNFCFTWTMHCRERGGRENGEQKLGNGNWRQRIAKLDLGDGNWESAMGTGIGNGNWERTSEMGIEKRGLGKIIGNKTRKRALR